MIRLILATHNPHKREELRQILRDKLSNGIEILTLEDIQPPIGDIEETGATLEENAVIKARTVFEKTGIPSVADDTGLEVDTLGGAPGVYSARYSGEGATYASNVQKLLGALEGTDDRHAKFSTVIAYVTQEGGTHLFRGEVEGTIARQPRGTNGFGYDPIFIPEDSDRTFAELSDHEKNAISHRGWALRAFTKYLHENLENRNS